MIEIKPVLSTQPIKKTTKIIRDQQHTKQHQPEEQNDNDDSNETEQHIDEIV